jgi:hypothetical protein
MLPALAGLIVSALWSDLAYGAAPTLMRYPYLTDMTATSVIVNFGTDTVSPHPTVTWGPSGSSCNNFTTSVNARQMTIAGQSEYQFWATLGGLAANSSYCYRVVQGGVDLLGSDSSPSFTTFQPAGTASSFSFAVFGDWGDVGSTGTNSDEANLMGQVAKSGASFLVTTGDNSYSGGSQTNYGDLVHAGDNTSAVFGRNFWPAVGKGIPAFLPMGNHGMASGSSYFLNWPQPATVAASGGAYQMQKYCCLNGTASATYPSAWYAFDYGQARFYVLEAAWANSNTGTGSLYQNDYDYHWASGSPEYQWLSADLAAHASTPLKFSFFHFPLHGDSSSEGTDRYLDGPGALEDLLTANGVSIAFTGHAHLYERNTPQRGSLVSYVTGGGGSHLEPLSKCGAFDAYAVGWSYARNVGSACGAASRPVSASQVFHFLLVKVSGHQVTVIPTDESGNTFDVQVNSFNGRSGGRLTEAVVGPR